MKNIKRIFLTICQLILFTTLNQGQNNFYTPETFELSKVAIQKPNLYTGQANINIPLLEISIGRINIPISISCNTDGLRPEKQADIVGLNWTLNAGGLITRSTNGVDDESTSDGVTPIGYFNAPKAYNNDQLRYLMVESQIDAYGKTEYSPDIFFFNMCGQSGKFIMGLDNKFKVQSNRKFIISHFLKPTIFGIGYDISREIYDGKLIITSDDGTEYEFGGDSYSVEYSFLDLSTYKWATAWYLTKISDVNGNIIRFYYDKEKESILSNVICQNNSRSILASMVNTKKVYLTRIESPVQTVDFNYSVKEKKVNGALSKKLDNIKITDIKGNISKLIDFQYQYFGSYENERLFLKSLKINNDPPYMFSYYKTDKLPNYNTYGIDHWGYYNGHNENTSLHYNDNTRYDADLNAKLDIARWEANSNYSSIGVLKDISYPTGGVKEFQYEGNTYSYAGIIFNGNLVYQNIFDQNREVGGLRIKRISLKDESQTKSSKEYFYTKDYPNNLTGSHLDECSGILRRRPNYLFLSVSVNELEVFGEPHVTYSEVTEVNSDKSYTKYYYNDLNDYPDFTNDKENDQGYKTFLLTPSCESYNERSVINTISKVSSCSIERGTLKRTKKFNSNGDLIEKHEWYYNDDPYRYNNKVTGLNFYKIDNFTLNLCKYNKLWYTIDYYTFPVSLTKEIMTTYYKDKVSPFVQNIEYKYNSDQLLIETIRSNSDGLKTISKNKYPIDFITDPIYYKMVDKNIINTIIINEIGIDENNDGIIDIITDGVKVNFSEFNNLFKPFSTEKFKTTGYKNDIIYDSYDSKGNLLQYHNKDDIDISYLYGYNNTLPIAKIVNAKNGIPSNSSNRVTQVHYESFEEVSSNQYSTSAKTGQFVHLGGYSLPLHNLIPGSYKLSYWTSENSIEWKYNLTNILVTENSNNYVFDNSIAYLDEIRIYPLNASMTTYSYSPLFGITSVTDENDITTYYEYDNNGRLMLIKDQYRNILKFFKYNIGKLKSNYYQY